MPVIITRGSFLEGWEACAAVLPHSVFVIVFADVVQNNLI
jgi:hypothetical protein